MEATEPPEVALKYYDELLETDSANAVCVDASLLMRKISLTHRYIGCLETEGICLEKNGKNRSGSGRTVCDARHFLHGRRGLARARGYIRVMPTVSTRFLRI